ncbi:hypothetical protein FXO37_04404 [Capsicum annuum]|nr:hypothetical protein FXO37_04404 [Capsicum annuum]
MLEIQQDNPEEIHVYMQGTMLKFFIIEYAIISGLKCSGSIEEHLFSGSSKSVLMAKYFPETKSFVKRTLFIERFKLGNFDNISDPLNMSIIYFIHTFLYSQVCDTTISRLNFVIVENGSYEQFPWGKSSFVKLIAMWRQDFFIEKQSYSMEEMPNLLNVWMYECCSEVDSAIAKRVKNVIPRIFNWKVVGIKVKYEKFIGAMFSKLVYNNIRPTHEEVQSLDLQIIEEFELNNDEPGFSPEVAAGRFAGEESNIQAEKRGLKIVGETVKSVDIDSADDSMDGYYFDWNRSPIQEQSEDVEGCCEDITTVRLDALVKSVVNQNLTNPNVGTPSTVHINKDHMDIEGVSADIEPATLESLIAVVENLKSDSANVGTSTMQVDYLSTLSESAQVELDAILEGIATPVDDLPIEFVPPSKEIMNKHDISDSQLPPDFFDAVVAAHQAAKNPAKRIRMRFKVFISPYTTEYSSVSKAIEDQIGEPKQKFAFDNFLISDNMPRGVIEEYKQWVEEELLKFYAKKYAEYLSEEMNMPLDGFEAEYHQIRYATLLRKYSIQKVQKGYVSENDDPPRPRLRNIRISGENEIVSSE